MYIILVYNIIQTYGIPNVVDQTTINWWYTAAPIRFRSSDWKIEFFATLKWVFSNTINRSGITIADKKIKVDSIVIKSSIQSNSISSMANLSKNWRRDFTSATWWVYKVFRRRWSPICAIFAVNSICINFSWWEIANNSQIIIYDSSTAFIAILTKPWTIRSIWHSKF